MIIENRRPDRRRRVKHTSNEIQVSFRFLFNTSMCLMITESTNCLLIILTVIVVSCIPKIRLKCGKIRCEHDVENTKLKTSYRASIPVQDDICAFLRPR